MDEIDDSVLLHYAKGYDPQKAREYYLRTRQLKGRRRGISKTAPTLRARTRGSQPSNSRTSELEERRGDSKARREELEARKEALVERLERLNDVLAEKVKAAKARSGVKDEPKKSTESSSSSTTSSKKKESETKSEPLTTSEKKEKAKKAREDYERENPGKSNGPSLNQEVEALQRQIQDVRSKIAKAIQDAKDRKQDSLRSKIV